MCAYTMCKCVCFNTLCLYFITHTVNSHDMTSCTALIDTFEVCTDLHAGIDLWSDIPKNILWVLSQGMITCRYIDGNIHNIATYTLLYRLYVNVAVKVSSFMKSHAFLGFTQVLPCHPHENALSIYYS